MKEMHSREAYIRMLEEAYKILPETGVQKVTSRFRPPPVEIMHHGKNRTIFLNFKEIATYLNRDPDILRKFITRELAAPASPSDGRLVLHTRVDSQTLQNTIEYFIRRYVKCPVCGGYDTKLIKQGRYLILKCEICGAESPVPPIR